MDPFADPPPRVPTHPACLPDEGLLDQCDVNRSRASGPGGQHRNKVETHITLTHRPTGVSGQAGERRSQTENRNVALFRLRLALAVEHREPVARGDARSALWRGRTRGGKIACSTEHRDFPALLAEAMDVLAESGWEPKAAAERLEVTPSQLVRFVKDHAPAFVRVNSERAARGMHALR